MTPFTTGIHYEYPLIIKKLLANSIRYASRREIFFRDKQHYTYDILFERIHRLASALADLGIKQGDIVGIMDYNSHRFLECRLHPDRDRPHQARLCVDHGARTIDSRGGLQAHPAVY